MGTEGPPSLPAAPLTLRELESCVLLFSLGQVSLASWWSLQDALLPPCSWWLLRWGVGQVDRLWGQSHRARLQAVAAAAAELKPPWAHT